MWAQSEQPAWGRRWSTLGTEDRRDKQESGKIPSKASVQNLTCHQTDLLKYRFQSSPADSLIQRVSDKGCRLYYLKATR